MSAMDAVFPQTHESRAGPCGRLRRCCAPPAPHLRPFVVGLFGASRTAGAAKRGTPLGSGGAQKGGEKPHRAGVLKAQARQNHLPRDACGRPGFPLGRGADTKAGEAGHEKTAVCSVLADPTFSEFQCRPSDRFSVFSGRKRATVNPSRPPVDRGEKFLVNYAAFLKE